MEIRKIENWKIIPTTGNTISLVGFVKSESIQTSNIVLIAAGAVRTKHNQYNLGVKLPGIWEIQLQMRRPKEYAKLQSYGIL